MDKGLFITFEGMEGSGKSTQTGLLASKLREMGIDIVVVREPGGTRIGEHIREITHNRENVDLTAVTECYLMAASRAQLVREIIRPALSEGKIVISDRYLDSSIAYQGFGRKLGEKEVRDMNSLAVKTFLPDLTFFLDLMIPEGFKRRNHTDKIDRLDLQDIAFYERVYEGYRKLAKESDKRIVTIDSSKSIEVVHEEIMGKVLEKIKGKSK